MYFHGLYRSTDEISDSTNPWSAHPRGGRNRRPAPLTGGWRVAAASVGSGGCACLPVASGGRLHVRQLRVAYSSLGLPRPQPRWPRRSWQRATTPCGDGEALCHQCDAHLCQPMASSLVPACTTPHSSRARLSLDAAACASKSRTLATAVTWESCLVACHRAVAAPALIDRRALRHMVLALSLALSLV